jgi:two-component system, NarL family, sensor histidine kinase DesK
LTFLTEECTVWIMIRLSTASDPDELRPNPAVVPARSESSDRLTETESARFPTLLGPRHARAILVAVFTGFYLVALSRIAYGTPDPVVIGTSAVYVTALAAIQLLYFSRPASELRTPERYVALVVQALLVYVPLVTQFHEEWIGMPGFLAGSVLLVLSWPLAWAMFVAVVISVAIAQAAFSGSVLDVVYSTVSTSITGLVVFGLTRLANVVKELHDARTELADLAVANERLRVARDLHDVLGYDVSAITLKTELARRLIVDDHARADAELAEVAEISRSALSHVRELSKGYRELSLEAETRAVRSLLLAAGVEVEIRLDYPALPGSITTVLATVLREATTNILRHTRASRCDIEVAADTHAVVVDIFNDGLLEQQEGVAGEGRGLANLTERVAHLGGELTAGRDPAGGFRLRASIPLRPAPQ